MREANDHSDLPKISDYLIEDEKILATRIVNAVQDSSQYPSLFEEHRQSLSSQDLQKMLIKFI